MDYDIVVDKKMLKHLSVDVRVRILKSLAKHRLTATDLSKKLRKHVTTVSEHLKKMERAGLVKKIPSKNIWKYYELTDKSKPLFTPKQSYGRLVLLLSISLPMIIYGLFTLVGVQPSLQRGIFATEQAVLGTGVQEVTTINYISLVVLCAGFIVLGMLLTIVLVRKSLKSK